MTADFDSRPLSPGQTLHVRRTTRFKSVWIDLFLPQPLRPVAATQLALVARLLERGTATWPDLRALNRHTDWLYGASLSSQTIGVGPWQILHLHYDAMAGAFAPDAGDDLLGQGLQLLSDVLHRPFLQQGQFPPERVAQEKNSLENFVESLDADRTGLAQRRCLQQIAAGTSWALEAHGARHELEGISADQLLAMLRQTIQTCPMDIYVCGDVDVDAVARLCQQVLPATGAAPELGIPMPWVELPAPTGPHKIAQQADVAQGRLAMGFRTGVSATGGGRAAAVLLNLILGGDAQSRLYQRIREHNGLCYHVASYADLLAGLLFVEAGIDADDRATVVAQILEELADLAASGPTSAELERARTLALQRLESAADGRDGLVRFHYARRLTGIGETRLGFHAAVAAVGAQDIRRLAGAIELDTEYFLEPTEPRATD